MAILKFLLLALGSSIEPLENDIEMHFSMDMAQQVGWT